MAETLDAATLAVDAALTQQIEALKAVSGEDYNEQAQILAKLVVILPRTSQQEADNILSSIGTIVPYLQSSNPHVKANACALLTAIATQSEALAEEVGKQASPQLLQLLAECGAAPREDQPDHQEALNLQINLFSALGQLVRDESCLTESLLQQEHIAQVLSACKTSGDLRVQEALADLLCALTAPEDTRWKLVDTGAVAAVAKLLSTEHLEVTVRALICLGMLLPNTPVAQQQLLQVEGAVACLLHLMRQSKDMDCRIIAKDLIGILTQDPEMKAQVEAVVRQQVFVGTGAP